MFNEIMQELRYAQGLTQEDLAIAMGLSRSTITKYEREERIPDLVIATRMAEYFGVSLDYLCGRRPSAKEKAAYEIVAMFDQKGLTLKDIDSKAMRSMLKVVSCVLDEYKNFNKK